MGRWGGVGGKGAGRGKHKLKFRNQSKEEWKPGCSADAQRCFDARVPALCLPACLSRWPSTARQLPRGTPPASLSRGCGLQLRAQEGGEGKAEEQTGGGEECARGREVGESECVSISGSGEGWYLRQSSRGGWVGGRGGGR